MFSADQCAGVDTLTSTTADPLEPGSIVVGWSAFTISAFHWAMGLLLYVVIFIGRVNDCIERGTEIIILHVIMHAAQHIAITGD